MTATANRSSIDTLLFEEGLTVNPALQEWDVTASSDGAIPVDVIMMAIASIVVVGVAVVTLGWVVAAIVAGAMAKKTALVYAESQRVNQVPQIPGIF